MTISAIVAVGKNNIIGDASTNSIPWYLPEDLKWFKKQTLGHAVVMGRKCYESIGRPLPKRSNIVITRDMFYLAQGCEIVHSIEEALLLAQEKGETEVFIIGGGEIYTQSLHLLDKIILTEVEIDSKGDVFFPILNNADWQLVFEEKHQKDEKNEYDYTFKILERK
jgi:dihydrofolate reductase